MVRNRCPWAQDPTDSDFAGMGSPQIPQFSVEVSGDELLNELYICRVNAKIGEDLFDASVSSTL